jgi:hypothetical protein
MLRQRILKRLKLVSPSSLNLRGIECPSSIKSYRFTEKAMQIHGDKYDYSGVKHINSMSKLVILFKLHGEFTQTPDTTQSSGSGCKKCGILSIIDKQSSNTEELIKKAIQVHDEKFDYSLLVKGNPLTKYSLQSARRI